MAVAAEGMTEDAPLGGLELSVLLMLDNPAINQRSYRHAGCEGGETEWSHPLDDCGVPFTRECEGCGKTLPVVTVATVDDFMRPVHPTTINDIRRAAGLPPYQPKAYTERLEFKAVALDPNPEPDADHPSHVPYPDHYEGSNQASLAEAVTALKGEWETGEREIVVEVRKVVESSWVRMELPSDFGV